MSAGKYLLVGNGAREAAFAQKLQREGYGVAYIAKQANAMMRSIAQRSGGKQFIVSGFDGDRLKRIVGEVAPDHAFVSADEPLAEGVTDMLRQIGVKTIGASKAAARIETDKAYALQIMKERCPATTPEYIVIETIEQARKELARFQKHGMGAVVKPIGLTGGKGVKVLGEHLADPGEALTYLQELIERDHRALLAEQLRGAEFTIMGFTDGTERVLSPASYDYPFRYDNDTGPGTGGMGAYTQANGLLPSISGRESFHAVKSP